MVTFYTLWLEQLKGRETFICKRFLEVRTRPILSQIKEGVGASSSMDQKVDTDDMGEIVGHQKNMFLLDFHNFHA